MPYIEYPSWANTLILYSGQSYIKLELNIRILKAATALLFLFSSFTLIAYTVTILVNVILIALLITWAQLYKGRIMLSNR